MSATNNYENWMHKKWRPAMGWLYMTTCAFDFIIFPIVWSATQALLHHPITPWDPLTLKGAGFYHLSMGAILGVAAWTRGQEKIAMMNNFSSNNSYQSNQLSSDNSPSRPKKPSARTILPEDPNEDADLKIK